MVGDREEIRREGGVIVLIPPLQGRVAPKAPGGVTWSMRMRAYCGSQ